MKRLLIMAMTMALVLVVGLAGAVSAASVTPIEVDPWSPGDAASEADQVGTYMYAYQIDDWDGDNGMDGEYVADFYDNGKLIHSNTITISNSGEQYFDWEATSPIGAVIVSGGPMNGRNAGGPNVFYYDPQADSDTELHPRINPSGTNPYSIESVTFCWNVEEVEYVYETAFAYYSANATSFLEEGFSRWGWTNGPLTEGTYEFELWAAAAQCDFDKGIEVGTVTVEYIGGSVVVTFNLDAPYVLEETHVYAGYDMFPKLMNGEPTVAPGQYYIEDALSGDIYVIVHAVVGIPVE